MKRLSVILLFLLLCLGCRHQGPPEYRGKTLSQWEAQAAGKDAAQRREAAESLGKIGLTGLPALVKLLHDGDHNVMAAANLAVIDMGSMALPELKELVHDRDKNVQANALKALMTILMNMRQKGVTELIELLKDSDPIVRANAAKTLAAMGMDANVAVPDLKELLHDGNPGVQRAAYQSLQIITGSLHPEGRAAPGPEPALD
jgi:HEAT repeat protein